jgi:hypothetical protein
MKTPFDDIVVDSLDGSPQKNQRKPWLNNQQQFEENIVEYMLVRYGLADTKTRFCLIDQHKTHRYEKLPENILTLNAFFEFFSEFPIVLSSHYLRKAASDKTDVRRLLCHFDTTPFGREYSRVRDGVASYVSTGVVFRWPRVNPADSFVVHNSLPVNERVAGVHMLWTWENRPTTGN